MVAPDREDEEIFLNPPSANKLSFFNLLRWCNIVSEFSLYLIDISMQSWDRLCQNS